MAFYLTFCAIFTVLLSEALGHSGTLYTGKNQNFWNPFARKMYFQDEYISELRSRNFNDVAKSACVTGIWLFYQHGDYNPNGGAYELMQYATGNNYCFNFAQIANRISSLRYAGPKEDPTTDSLTLYEHDDFQGQEEFIIHHAENLAKLAGKHKSIIITGKSDWTVFDKPDFKGRGVCLRKNGDHNPKFIRNIAHESISHNSIRSIKIGCS